VADAIAQGDLPALKDELGDLLLQVVFHARMAEEAGAFDFDAVAAAISAKMVRRHPHVFAGGRLESTAAQTRAWEDHKSEERRAKAASDGRTPSVLDGVALGLPALTRALKLQRRAARVGFDWPEVARVLDKIEEEIGELRAEMDSGAGRERLEDELGDILFAVVNLARHFDIDPEAALRGTNDKFVRRFHAVEEHFAGNAQDLTQASLEEMESAWQAAKAGET
jgi:nucleoside triphosphate diphosphatase